MTMRKLFDVIPVNTRYNNVLNKVSNHWLAGGNYRTFYTSYETATDFAKSAIVPVSGLVVNFTLATCMVPLALTGIVGMALGMAVYGTGKATHSDSTLETGINITNYSAGFLFSGILHFFIALVTASYGVALNTASLATCSYSSIEDAINSGNEEAIDVDSLPSYS